MKIVKTRFAPSPTGFHHIGNFRTCVYAWLYARKMGGKFILRIEDTDRDRTVPGSIRYNIESLKWLGMDYDEGPTHADLKAVGEYWDGAPDIGGENAPYIQSLRKDIYKEYAEKLIASGHAYRCDCTSEMLEQERNEQMARKEQPGYSGYCRTRNVSADAKHIIRLKFPRPLNLGFEDLVRGKMFWETAPLADPVLLKTDGFPTYHLAANVDDHIMGITHVLRGEEWLPTAPIHLYLYDCFGWERPIFGHLSHIMGNDGKKLSKRTGALGVDEFRKAGFLPEALVNFISLIGWSPGEGNNKEVFSMKELIEAFSLEHLGNSSGVFDPNKLNWMNGVYIRSLSESEFTAKCLPLIEEAGLKFNQDRWQKILPFVRERMKSLNEVAAMVDFLFLEKITPDESELYKNFTKEKASEVLAKVKIALSAISESDFISANVEAALKSVVAESGEKLGNVFHLLRISITGKTATPPLFDSIVALGRTISLERLSI